MLKSVRLREFRSFQDTGVVSFRRLNVFIGPNSAGKSAFLSALELFLRSLRAASRSPLVLDELPAFASFDSVLRRHWTPKKPRPHEFLLNYVWTLDKEQDFTFDFVCRGRRDDSTSYVAQETFAGPKGDVVHVTAADTSPARTTYTGEYKGESLGTDTLYFRGPVPISFDRPFDFGAEAWRLSTPLEVVHPFRPVPRSFYVLDDPGLSTDDRSLLSFLIEVWRSRDRTSIHVRERVLENLRTLGLAQYFNVKPLSSATGPKVVKIEVAPALRRQSVTIADVGFGLSQVLPLAAYEARLFSGCLIAYQPEVHLHPKAQSRLADVFTKSIHRGNQLFIETHSADLLLRLQQQVAAGLAPPDTVRIFCLSNEKGTTRIQTVDLMEGGRPAIPWPPGFLDTSLSLARDLAAKRRTPAP